MSAINPLNQAILTMNALACDNLEIVVLDGVDHHFTDKVDDFIALADLL